jgi:DNA-binding winged helix-turn-helix (wHTH) protein/Tol biopolymer transport system component
VAVSPVEDVIRFGLFELDLKAGQLSRNGTKIRLPQQPLQLLAVFLECPGEVLTREELRQRLWSSDVFVDFDHGLNKSVQKLRDALGDSATSPRYIETIPRVGYRFIAPVRNGTRPLELETLETDTPPKPKADIKIGPATLPATAGQRVRWWMFAAGVCGIFAIIGIAVYLAVRSHPPEIKYTQLTDFTDSATTPALSPDGHMVAFIRGSSTFMSADQIYVKMLPDGEARRLTNDPRLKYNLAFSPDGSQIAYTVLQPGFFATYTVPVLGGDSHLLLNNAAGLTWLDQNHFLFSKFHSGLHLGVVTQTDRGDDYRELYFPAHERGMAHYSYASPDRSWALIVEMNGDGNWGMCRLISLSGPSQTRPIGPAGACTSAGWSPDGTWMYFSTTVEEQSHLWRQRFPNGQPEQITFGPTEEAGIAMEPDGRSLITSIGVHESAIWIHDPAGERSLSSEGEIVAYLSPPSFTADGKTLYYLLQHPSAAGSGPELWRMTVDSGNSEQVFPGISMSAYDVSPDGKQVVYSSVGQNGSSQLWLAPIDRSSPAKQIGLSGETTPHFGQQGKILFRFAEGNSNYLEQMNQDGSGRSKVVPYPIIEIQGISPGRKWLMAIVPYPDGKTVAPTMMAIPLDGGPPRRMCETFCSPFWSPNGKFLFIPVEASSETSSGRSLAIPVGPAESIPPFPSEGIVPMAQPDVVPGSQSVNRADLVPGADLSHFAYVNTTAHRNLYRVSLP